MKKFLQKFALVCAALLPSFAWGQTVTVTANLQNMFGAAQATKTQVCFSLTDGNGNQLSNPRTSGGVIVPTATQCVLPNGSGVVSTPVIANDQITPAGSIYSVTYLFNGRQVHGDIYQFLLADGTENLNTKVGLTTPPVVPTPTGDTTYARLDGANSPFTNPIGAPVFNASTGFEIAGGATSGRYLKGNGTNFVVSNGAAAGVGSNANCSNSFLTQVNLNNDTAPTGNCAAVTQGAVTNGYVDLSSAQNVGGVKTFTSDSIFKSMNGLTVVYADQFANVQAAITACPSTGCLIDARSPNVNLTLGALDTGSNTKIVTLLLGPFTYTFTQITVRQGFNIVGAGILDTLLNNNGTNANPAFVIPQVNNNIITVHWSDFTVNALAGNTSQDGIFFDASTLTNAGVQYSTFTNIIFLGFNGVGVHLKCTQNGSSGSIGCIQGDTFTNVQSTRPSGATGASQNALRIDGAVGQIEFWNCWFLGTTNDTGTNVFVGTNSTSNPYSIHFHGTTVQNGNAYTIDGANSVTTENDHFEQLKGVYNLLTTSQLIVGINFKTPFINSNVGVNAGNGYIINTNSVTNCDVTLDSPFLGVSPDNLVKNTGGNACSVRLLGARTFNSATPTNVFVTSGVTGTATPAATLDIRSWTTVQLSSSATSITTLRSNLSPGESVTFFVSSGTAQFATGGNLGLALAASPYVVNAGDSVTFTRVDAGTPAFILTGTSVTRGGTAKVDTTGLAANVGSTVLYTVPANQGGMYLISGYDVVTQQATTTSTLPNIQIVWTDNDTNVASAAVNLTPSSAGGPANPAVGFNSLNNVGAAGVGNIITVSAKAGSNINYQTVNYASTGATAMQYALHIKVQYLGQ